MSVIDEIAAERRRQVEVEGWSAEHDDLHHYGEMAQAAAAYASHTDRRSQADVFVEKIGGGRVRAGWFNPYMLLWPWSLEWWKPTTRRHDLIKAAALIVS